MKKGFDALHKMCEVDYEEDTPDRYDPTTSSPVLRLLRGPSSGYGLSICLL
jgi:hypothetical protein